MERGIPRSIQRKQDFGVDDEAIRSAITEQCIRQEPTASLACYSAQDWELNFERRWILQDERYMRTSTEIQGSGGAIYCRSCVEPRKHGKLAAFRLHVTIETQDPMQVAKHGIIQLECHGCGFEQVVHRKPRINKDGYTMDEYSKLDARALTAMEQQMKSKLAQDRLDAMRYAMQGKSIYDPRMAAQGIGGGHLQRLGEEMQNVRAGIEAGVIDPKNGKEILDRLMQLANRQANVAASPPLMIKPPKGPFDPP